MLKNSWFAFIGIQRDANMKPLSKRELEILLLIAQEQTTVEIGKMLFISPGTVETHRKNMMNKLQVRNLAGLMLKACYENILIFDEAGLVRLNNKGLSIQEYPDYNHNGVTNHT